MSDDERSGPDGEPWDWEGSDEDDYDEDDDFAEDRCSAVGCKLRYPVGKACDACSPVVLDVKNPFRRRLARGGRWMLFDTKGGKGEAYVQEMSRKHGILMQVCWLGDKLPADAPRSIMSGDSRPPDVYTFRVAVAPAVKWAHREVPGGDGRYGFANAASPGDEVAKFSKREKRRFQAVLLVVARLQDMNDGLRLPVEVWLIVLKCALPEARAGGASVSLKLAGLNVEVREGYHAVKMSGGSLTMAITTDGLLKGEQVLPAWKSLTESSGKMPRTREKSHFFTGYPITLGHTGDALTKLGAAAERFHDAAAVVAAEEDRAAAEAALRDERRRKVNLPFEFETGYDEYEVVCPENTHQGDWDYGFDSGDEEKFAKITGTAGAGQGDVPGADWSGRPGYTCECCGRRSENVGPRRGFDYKDSFCGGCGDLSEMSDADERKLQSRFAPPVW